MALIVRQGEAALPSDAVRLTADQALRYQHAIISNWPNFSEVFSLRIGPGIMIGLAGLSGFFINNHFRYKLKLSHYGRASSYVAIVATPGILAGLTHFTYIQTRLILKAYDCPLCLQTQAGIAQASSAVVWPFFLAPMASFMYATRHFTFKLPSITEQPKEIVALWWKFCKSGKNLGLSLFAINMLAAMFLTSKEFSQYANICREIEEEEERIHSDLVPLDVDKRR